jgi:hypothetical protein
LVSPRRLAQQGVPVSIEPGRRTRRIALLVDERAHGRSELRAGRQLCTDHRVDEGIYREAEATFGTEGLIDLTTLIGVYHGVCITLTMFAVPASRFLSRTRA